MDTVLITGTTSGIGAAFAEKFAKEGNNLILVSRNVEKLQRQQAELQSRYQVSVECISCDLAEDGAAELIADKVRELGLSVDVFLMIACRKTHGRQRPAGCDAADIAGAAAQIRTHLSLRDLVLAGAGLQHMGKQCPFSPF